MNSIIKNLQQLFASVGVLMRVVYMALTFCAVISQAEDISISKLDPVPFKMKDHVVAVSTTTDGKKIIVNNVEHRDGVSVAGGAEMCFLVGTAEGLKGFVAVYHDSAGEMLFTVYGDSRILWRSGVLRSGDPLESFEIELQGIKLVRLSVVAPDGSTGGWLKTRFVHNGEGVKPAAVYNPETYESLPEWQNPRVFRKGTEPSTATMMTYDDPKSARFARSRADSPWFMSLDGPWKFDWVAHPDRRKRDFCQLWFSTKRWMDIDVPGCVELQGFGTPIYKNSGYYFKVDPPYVMGEPDPEYTTFKERNAVSSYRRSFVLPKRWKDRRVLLRFDGFSSAIYVWLNGKQIGYAEDGRQGATFDISQYLMRDKNILAVEVYRLCDGSYMEDQDLWRLSGLYRSVYLWSVAKSHISDFFIQTTPAASEEHSGGWNLKVTGDVVSDTNGLSVVAELYPKSFKGKRIAMNSCVVIDGKIQLNLDVDSPRLWSAEHPNLYALILTLKDRRGKIVESIPQSVGFRTVELKNSRILINGQPILFKGVNRHEFDPDGGYTLSYERMREDVLLMKRLNINAVRSSHYPNDPRWYDLCDEYGLYVMNAANLDTRGLAQCARNPTVDPVFRSAALDRAMGVVERDKNHPSVVIWSLGNANNVDSDFFEQAGHMVRSRDPGRPIQNKGNAPLPNVSDYWRLIREYDNLQGGFITDFVDQGLRKRIPSEQVKLGQPTWFWAYGGDYGDYPNDGNLCCNGLVDPDRCITPQVAEVRWCYQPAFVKNKDMRKGVFTIENDTFFTNLREYECLWRYEEDGKVVSEGSLGALNIEPRHSIDVEIPVNVMKASVRRSYVAGWRFDFVLRKNQPWAKKGFSVATDQILLPEEILPSWESGPEDSAIEMIEGEERIEIVGQGFSAAVSRLNGALISWNVDGQEFLMTPLEPEFWRAPTDTDHASGMAEQQGCWRYAAAKRVIRDVLIKRDDEGNRRIEVSFALPQAERSSGVIDYTFRQGGDVRVAMTLTPKGSNLPSIPRVGMTMQISPALDRVTWLGRGPGENYCDRKGASFYGLYSLAADDLFFPYVKPQASGNRTDTFYVDFTNSDGAGFRVSGAPKINFNISPYTIEELSSRDHPHELNRCGNRVVNIDYGQMGVAGGNSPRAHPWPEYQLSASKIWRYEFVLSKIY